MKKLSILIIALFFLGCSSKISHHFEHNKYIKNFNVHILNDSLQLYFKTPADIRYVTHKKELNKIIRQEKFKIQDSVLVYGKTDDPPYEYFVTLSKTNLHEYPKELVVFDTLIHKHTIRFIGNALIPSAKKTLERDLEDIFKSLQLGPNYRKQISTVFDIVEKYQPSNKFYAALNEIKEFPTYDKQEEWTKRQMELTFSSFLGKNEFYTTYLDQLEARFKANDTIAKIIKENAIGTTKVFDTLISQAKKHKIVMINENHFYPNHRLFVSDLLEGLKEIGYTYLALEALDSSQDSLLNKVDAYPTLATGFYTSEQNYAHLIRKAKELGYRFIAYENTNPDKNRELGQAENLYDQTFKINPNAKVLVFAGIDHILEKPTSSGKEWMATLFKTKYNIDPLTLSQTHLNGYRKQIESTYGMISSTYFDKWTLTSVDYLILNNNQTLIAENQPTFTYKNRAKEEVQLCLFYEREIINKYDYSKKIPYFTTLLRAGEKCQLPLDEDRIIYLYTLDKEGRQVEEQIINPTISNYK